MIETTTHLTDVAGVQLEEQHTIIGFGIGPAGLAIAYRRPTAVVTGTERHSIPDVMLTVKLVALLITVAAMLIRRSRA